MTLASFSYILYCNNSAPLPAGYWKSCRPRAKYYVTQGPQIDRVGFSCLLLKGRGLATSSRFGDDWLLHHMPWSSYLQTAHCIQICRHSIRPPPLRFNNKQLKPTRSIHFLATKFSDNRSSVKWKIVSFYLGRVAVLLEVTYVQLLQRSKSEPSCERTWLDTPDPKIFLVRGCENVDAMLRQKLLQQGLSSPL